jgi:O-antigen ligase
VKLEALTIDTPYAKWIALVVLEMAIGVYCLIMPSKIAVLSLILVPLAIVMMSNYFYAYLLGIFLLPVWSVTLIGQAEATGQVDLRFSDACFMIAGLGWIARAMARHQVTLKGSRLDFWLLTFFLWILLSILWCPSFGGGVKEFLRKLNGLFIFYLTINLVRNQRQLDRTLMTWIISGGFAAFLAVHEVFTEILYRAAGFSKGAIARWGFLRATALKEGANRLGFFMNTCLVMTLSLFFLQPGKKFRLLSLFLFVTMFFALLSTLSRNSLLGFVVGTMLVFYITKKGGKRFFITGAVIVGLFLMISGPTYRDVFFKRFLGGFQPQVTRSVAGRLQVWEAGSEIIGASPFLGAGAGGFHIISEYYGAQKLKSPHSLYIYVTAEYGLIGFVLFAAVTIAFLRLGNHGLRVTSDAKAKCVLAALLATIAIYAFQGLVVNFVLIEREFWALLGLNVAAIEIYSEGEFQ